MNQENIGKKIAFLRKKRNLTQEQLGEKICVSSKTISKWERGVSLPDVLIVTKICDVLGVSVEELLLDKQIVSGNVSNCNKKFSFNDFFGKKKIFIILPVIFIFILLFLFIHYNSLHVFTISSNTDDFIVNGYTILNLKKNILIINNIEFLIESSEKYDKIKITKIEIEIDNANKIVLYYNNIKINNETLVLDDNINDVAIYVEDFKYNYLLNGNIEKICLKIEYINKNNQKLLLEVPLIAKK